MAYDPFYALHDILRFIAFNKTQFFNFISSRLRMELDHSALIYQDSQTLSNVLLRLSP